MNKKANIWIYILAIYVMIQLIWWGVLLIQLTQQISNQENNVDHRILMIAGEGIIFFVILLFGIIKISNSIKKELELNSRQKNFLLAVTHELKTPLTSTQLNVQTLQKRILSESQHHLLLNHIQEDTTRLTSLIDNILKITQIENNNYRLFFEKMNTKELVEKLINRFKLIYPSTIIENNISSNLELKADKDGLETIMSNLIHNAIKYGNGNVIVGCEDKYITIEDDGGGIPLESRENVFKRFVRLENEETRSVDGTGIGLYLVKTISNMHHWKVQIKQSEKLGGTKMIIKIQK